MSDESQLESVPELTTVAEKLIQLPDVDTLWIAKVGLIEAEEVWLAVEVSTSNSARHGNFEEVHTVCQDIDRVTFDTTVYPFVYSIETKFIAPEFEVTFFMRDKVDLPTGIENLRDFLA